LEGDAKITATEPVRAGSRALSILADPLKAWTLRTHLERPLRFRELEERIGWAAPTTLRTAIADLRRIGVLAKHPVSAMPRRVENELTAAGRELIFVADALERWLSLSPAGLIKADGAAARGAVKALAGGWNCGAVRTLAEGPVSLTELSIVLDGFSYHSLERRLVKMRTTGQIESIDSGARGVPYAATDWLRRAIAPLSAATRWERRHLPDSAEGAGREEVEATFLLALPLVEPSGEIGGECALGVTIGEDGDSEVAGVDLRVEPGGIVSRPLDGKGSPTRAVGPPDAWHDAIIDGDHSGLCLSGSRPSLPRSIVEAINDSLFAVC
jgi:DNA-binding HxlR family transcriptional regulator